MTYLLRGALIEYGTDFLGPIPNCVVFQFNPESLTRNLQIPSRSAGSAARETSQAGEHPVENISLIAHFSAADQLKDNHPITRTFGIAPQLAALEKMAYPLSLSRSVMGRGLDRAGELLRGASEEGCPSQPIPREHYPRLLFIWGVTRVLPVLLSSMNITEQQYDHLLNPTQAEVSLGLDVLTSDPCSEDLVARGALEYTKLVKEAQATSNLAISIEQIIDTISI